MDIHRITSVRTPNQTLLHPMNKLHDKLPKLKPQWDNSKLDVWGHTQKPRRLRFPLQSSWWPFACVCVTLCSFKCIVVPSPNSQSPRWSLSEKCFTLANYTPSIIQKVQMMTVIWLLTWVHHPFARVQFNQLSSIQPVKLCGYQKWHQIPVGHQVGSLNVKTFKIFLSVFRGTLIYSVELSIFWNGWHCFFLCDTQWVLMKYLSSIMGESLK